MKFKYYDMMKKVILDHEVGSELIDPRFGESTDDSEPIRKRRRKGETNMHHQEEMRRIQQAYNEESLQLQRQALALEQQKVDLLKAFLDKP